MLLRFALPFLLVIGLQGCVAIVAGTGGAVAFDEGVIENDGIFDPLEDTELGRAIYQ
ncbi:MAG: hypothetical protein AAGC81_10485 [Pseudomonadota bacterium]